MRGGCFGLGQGSISISIIRLSLLPLPNALFPLLASFHVSIQSTPPTPHTHRVLALVRTAGWPLESTCGPTLEQVQPLRLADLARAASTQAVPSFGSPPCCEMDGITNQPIVIDNGTGVLKAGFAGGDRPRVIFSSAVGRPKHVRMMPGGALEGTDVCVGSKLQEHRGAFRWSYPMEHGVVMDWQDMERVWSHLYSRDQLNVPSEEHPVRV